MSQKPGFKGVPGSSVSSGVPVQKEYTVILNDDPSKKYCMMQFNRGDNVDLSKWKQARLERENNLREFKILNPDMPVKGAGSEFGRERREEARRKKYGIVAKRYKEENQPWILKQIGAPAKKYKGKKEGLMSEVSSYYVFKQLADGQWEATPIDATYSFTAMAKHKTLSAEEAEEEFGRRDRTFNYFTLMVKKRLKESAGEELSKEEEEEMKAKTKKTGKRESFKITEDDDYHDLMTSEESDAYSNDGDEGTEEKSKRKGSRKANKGKKKQDSDDEGEEESDEGDFEGKELDYISENSSDDDETEQQKMDIKGLDEEIQKIEDEEEDEEEEEGNKQENEKEMEDGDKEEKVKREGDESSSSSSGSDDSDIDDTQIHSALMMQKRPTKRPATPTIQAAGSKSESHNASRSQTPSGQVDSPAPSTTATLSEAADNLQQSQAPTKRPGTDEGPSAKRPKLEERLPVTAGLPAKQVAANRDAAGLTEEVVRRYLMRKPMTTKDLLYKLKSKKIGLKPDVIVKRLTEILRKLNPKQTKIKNKTYWYIKG